MNSLADTHDWRIYRFELWPFAAFIHAGFLNFYMAVSERKATAHYN
jgi:hypothetical protein